MNSLRIELKAANLSDLTEAMRIIKNEIEPSGFELEVTAFVDNCVVTGAVKAKAGKANKKADADPAPVETTAEPAETQPTETSTPSLAPADNVVSDLSADEARKKGIDEMQKFFGANPNCMDEIKKLQTKYGVKMFSEIPDSAAASFYADVKLLVSGSKLAA